MYTHTHKTAIQRQKTYPHSERRDYVTVPELVKVCLKTNQGVDEVQNTDCALVTAQARWLSL